MPRENIGATDTKLLNASDIKNEISPRKRAMFVTKDHIENILLRNVQRNVSRTYTQYTKELIKTYIVSPNANLDNIREVSRFLERYSKIYQMFLMYYAATPLMSYNITQINDLTKKIDSQKSIKNYGNVLKEFNKYDIKREGYTALYIAIRDGFYVAYHYQTNDSIFPLILDQRYCRIKGKNKAGQWVVYFNAAYFDVGNNSEYLYGVNEDGEGIWDQVFIDGYEAYLTDRRGSAWFPLPPEKTCVLIAGPEDEFDTPLPWLLGLFTDLLDLLDLQSILQSKAELENYKLIVNKIPLMKDSDSVDDFAISEEFTKVFTQVMENNTPDLVGVTYSPFDIEVVNFEKSNVAADTDALGKAINNFFNNAGATQLVVAGGGNTSNLAIKYSQLNDQSDVWTVVNRYESWLNYFIKMNIKDGYALEILPISWYNREDYIKEQKDIATLGGPALNLLVASEGSPYKVIQKLRFEEAIGLKDMMVPLKSSYQTNGSDINERGRPTVDDDELSDSAERSRNQ